MKGWTWILVLLGVAAAPAARADFDRQALSVPGAVLWIAHGDLDGDKFTDLVVSYRRGSGPKAAKYLAIFFRGPKGYSERPDLAYQAPTSAATFDVGDAVGDGRDELLFMTRTGVFVQQFEGRKAKRPRRLLAVPTLVSGPEEEDLVAWDFLRHPKALARPILMVPGQRRLRVYQRHGEEWKLWADPRLDLFSYYDAESPSYRRSGRGGATGRPYAFRVTTIVPNLEWVDQTGDGRVDLVAFYEDRVALFPQGADGKLSNEPQQRRWFRMLTDDELESRDVRVSARVQDLDQDGIADLVLGKIGGGVRTLKTELRLYRGLKGGGFSPKPAQVFKDDGFAALSDFIDVDGDGALEMVHPYAPVSIMTISKAMLSSTLDLSVRIREPSRDGGLFFVPKPAQVLDTSYGLDLSVGAAIRGAAPIFGHDFTGDGVPDVLVSDGGEAMVLHAGRRGTRASFDEDDGPRLEASGSNTTQTIPVRPGSAAVDVVVFYVARKAMAGRLYVFTQRSAH